ncbi:hypothetical protein JVT61DRAFT_11770 [Boletus reticuloceps]|uniref:Uncharacterized protein n=1 Tax=Boletus reticuloceps TaxID=495285 RepID=A0A8I2YU20_9AGAM|nr:hypothetical protein JVT61DRAFT_11770 [Boletus reticuloceps]
MKSNFSDSMHTELLRMVGFLLGSTFVCTLAEDASRAPKSSEATYDAQEALETNADISVEVMTDGHIADDGRQKHPSSGGAMIFVRPVSAGTVISHGIAAWTVSERIWCA